MSEKGSYELPKNQSKAQTEIERLATQAQSGWDKEARMLSWFGLEDGMSVLELGSGPGFITHQLIDLVPNSLITCVELDPTLINQAKTYLEGKASQPLTFIEGSLLETNLPSNQFDFAYGRFLFQHLPDPVSAAKEILRVLKPGGKLLICDIDDELFGLFEPPLPEFKPVLEAFGKAQAARNGDRNIGRKLADMLTKAGFATPRLDAIASHSADRGIDSYLQHLQPDRMQPLVAKGLLSDEELEQFRSAIIAWAAHPDAYTLWITLMVCAEKPAAG